MIIMIAVFFVFMLIFVGTNFYYWMQLNAVATQMANYLVGPGGLTTDETALTADQQTTINNIGNKMLTILRLPNMTVTSSSGGASSGGLAISSSFDLSQMPAVGVSLTLTGIQMFGNNIPWFPIVGTGAAVIGANQPFKHYCKITMSRVGGGQDGSWGVAWMPCYYAQGSYNNGPFGTDPSTLGLTELIELGVNSTYDSCPKNVWGSIYDDSGAWVADMKKDCQ
jgi:hypothetical protein